MSHLLMAFPMFELRFTRVCGVRNIRVNPSIVHEQPGRGSEAEEGHGN